MQPPAGESQCSAPFQVAPSMQFHRAGNDESGGAAAVTRLGSIRPFSKETRDIMNIRATKHLLWLSLLSTAPAHADIHPCAERADPQARLACYDEVFPPRSAAPATVPVRSEAERIREFGLTQRAVEESKPAAEREQPIERIEASVTEVRSIQGGQRLLSLDNGHTWRIVDGGSRGFLKVGDRVMIRRGLMGSHILSTPGGVGLRVRRVD